MKLQSSITVHVRDSSQSKQSGNSKTETIFGQENGFELINSHQIEVYWFNWSNKRGSEDYIRLEDQADFQNFLLTASVQHEI